MRAHSCGTGSLPQNVEAKGTTTVRVLSNGTCEISHSGGGVWKYAPLLVTMGIFIGLAFFWILWENVIVNRCRGTRAWYRFLSASAVVRSDLGSSSKVDSDEERLLASSGQQIQPTRRLKSLDTFRGLALVVMIFVNYGGGGYWFFQHSYWNGLTVADLVFPWFVFILGTSAAISLSSLDRHGVSRCSVLFKVLRRFIVLFGLGLFLNKTNVLTTYRVPGVLQRLAICYLAVCLLHLCLSPRPDAISDTPSRFSLREIRHYLLQWFIALDLILGHLLITYLVHKPGCPSKYLGPAGMLGDYGEYNGSNCTGGAAGYIDELIFGVDHIYQTPTCKTMYLTGPYDPEGILGTLTCIYLAFLGMHAGRILLLYHNNRQRMIRWLLNGVLWGLIGAGLCQFQQNGGMIPINKNLWSVSYVLVMAGTSFMLLTMLYYVIDIKKLWSGAPFFFVGMNSILVYVGHEMVRGYFPFDWKSDANYTMQMARNITGTTLWVIIAYYLYHINFFVKI